ncbi:MAG: M17 family peptidase N-terminal domain-containing protein, partial [Candidatus Acidiferrales bacterium]
MEIRIESQPYFAVQTDALVTYVFDKDDKFDGVLGEIDRALNGQLASLASSGELTGKSLELTLLHFPQGLTAKKLLLVGAGKPERFAVSDLRK